MTFNELYDYVRVTSGNFIIPEESMELGMSQFHILLRNSIGWYQRYTPLLFTFNINTHGSVNYQFNGTEYPKYTEWNIPIIPNKLSDVFPVYSSLVNPFVFRSISMNSRTPLSSLSDSPKSPFIWRYDSLKGLLALDRGGELEIKAMYFHPIIERTFEIKDEEDNIIATRTEVDLPSINPTDIDFLNMITANYMIAIAHARSLFANSNSPLTIDFSTMLSEGTSLLEASKQSIIDNSDFYLSYN